MEDTDRDVPQLGFFKLTVAEMDRAQAFYEAAFGMTATSRVEQPGLIEVIMKSPGNPFALTLMQFTDGRDVKGGNGYGPVGFYVADIDAALGRAEAAGARSLGKTLRFADVSYVFLRSPDGHLIEFIQRAE